MTKKLITLLTGVHIGIFWLLVCYLAGLIVTTIVIFFVNALLQLITQAGVDLAGWEFYLAYLCVFAFLVETYILSSRE